MLHLRKCASDTGIFDDREMYVLYDYIGFPPSSGLRDALIGMDSRGETNYQHFLLPEGKYLCILCRNSFEEKNDAFQKLRLFIAENNVTITGKLIFVSKIIDISAAAPEDYLVELQVRTD
jgi:effector-binding domain-containing protein